MNRLYKINLFTIRALISRLSKINVFTIRPLMKRLNKINVFTIMTLSFCVLFTITGIVFLSLLDFGSTHLLRVFAGIVAGSLINIYFLIPKYGVFLLPSIRFIWHIAMILNILTFVFIIMIVIWNIKNVYLSTIKKFIIRVVLFYWCLIGIITANCFCDSRIFAVIIS